MYSTPFGPVWHFGFNSEWLQCLYVNTVAIVIIKYGSTYVVGIDQENYAWLSKKHSKPAL